MLPDFVKTTIDAQGKLELEFVPIRNYACVNAIEVTQGGE
jgi:hypothetical protein